MNVFSIYMPPLRERRPDIPLLADHFVEKYAAAHGKDVRRIATTAIDMLMSYHWPGNVRELENCIERAVLVCEGGVIHAHHLPPSLQTAEVSGTLPRQSLEDAPWSLREGPHPGRAQDARAATGPGPRACSTPPSGSSATRSESTGSSRRASAEARQGSLPGPPQAFSTLTTAL